MESGILAQKTLEELEQDFWGDPKLNSRLILRCHDLRKKPVGKFMIEDLRRMIGQQIGLIYLLPLAIEKLKENLFAEGDYYPGDLLKMILDVDIEFWKNNKELWIEIDTLINNNMSQILEMKISIDTFRKVDL
jgi:CDI immunity proteins